MMPASIHSIFPVLTGAAELAEDQTLHSVCCMSVSLSLVDRPGCVRVRTYGDWAVTVAVARSSLMRLVADVVDAIATVSMVSEFMWCSWSSDGWASSIRFAIMAQCQ